MNLRIRQLKRSVEERDKTLEILKKIERHHFDNKPLICAFDNSLFRHILSAIEMLSSDLKFAAHPRNEKNKKYMTNMVRYDIDLTNGRKKALVWVYFPSGGSEYNTVSCRLQKFSYTSPKVEQPRPTDNRGYPTLKVNDFSDIDELIDCLNEVIPNIHRK